MRFSLFVETKLREKSGLRLSTAADIERLVYDIESTTHEHVGVNTVKRLLGYHNDEREPRTTTLDVIARYLGYDTWKQLREVEGKSNSGWGSADGELDVASLPDGQLVCVTYRPDRRLLLRHEQDKALRVLESTNSKLLVDDRIDISTIIEGYPLVVENVHRNGNDLGRFIAGKLQGIKYQLLESGE